jgi:hypothetical protein
MIYTSKIKTIVKRNSFYTTEGVTIHNYVVTFANGHNPNIYSKKPLRYNKGDDVTYDLDQVKNKAKFVFKSSSNYLY